MRILAFVSLIFLSAVLSPRFALAAEPADSQGYFNCLTTRESRAVLGNKPICVLDIECERTVEGAPGPQAAKRQAVCDVIARNNRCPEASGCLADTSVTEEDYKKIPKELRGPIRDFSDACFKATEGANRLTAGLKEKAAAGLTTTKPPGAPATSPGLGGPRSRGSAQ